MERDIPTLFVGKAAGIMGLDLCRAFRAFRTGVIMEQVQTRPSRDLPSSVVGHVVHRSGVIKETVYEELSESEVICRKVRDNSYALDLYRALCNRKFFKGGVARECTWRVAAGIVYELVHGRNSGNERGYLDYYCDGQEGVITDEIGRDLCVIGWHFNSADSDTTIPPPLKRGRYIRDSCSPEDSPSSPVYSPTSPAYSPWSP